MNPASLPVSDRPSLGFCAWMQQNAGILSFRTAFGERAAGGRCRDVAFFGRIGQPFAAFWTPVPLHSELISDWASGPKATALDGDASEALIGRALDGFGALFGEPALARREFERGLVRDWNRDPFARDAYTYVAVRDAQATLAAPVDGTLLFAGEATSNDGQAGALGATA